MLFRSGRVASVELVQKVLAEEVARLLSLGFNREKLDQAARLFERVSLDQDYVDFLTLPALDMID